MAIVGEGTNRDCCECKIRLGCYEESGEMHDCSPECAGICPDTTEVSHGLCDICFARARKR